MRRRRILPSDVFWKYLFDFLPGDANMESWKVADMSAGGYCLLHDSEDASRARIGELVAIANSRDRETGNWHLGVVRWMKFSADRGLELGIQMLSRVQSPSTPAWKTLTTATATTPS